MVRSVIRFVSRHQLPVGGLPMDLGVEIGERGAEGVVQEPDAVFIRSCVRLGRMVDEVVGEEVLEDLEITTALHFFGIAADDSFCGLG